MFPFHVQKYKREAFQDQNGDEVKVYIQSILVSLDWIRIYR